MRCGSFLFVTSTQLFSSKHKTMYLKVVSCCLVSTYYNFFLGIKTKSVRSSFLKAVQFFLETIALYDIHATEQCFDSRSKGNVFSPQEREMYNYSKCTIIVRIMKFVTLILETCQQDFWEVGTEIHSE